KRVVAVHAAIGRTAIEVACRLGAVRKRFVGTGRASKAEAEAEAERKDQCAHHDSETLMEPSPITVPVKTTPLSMLRTLTRSPAAPACNGTPATEISRIPCTKRTCTGLPVSTR